MSLFLTDWGCVLGGGHIIHNTSIQQVYRRYTGCTDEVWLIVVWICVHTYTQSYGWTICPDAPCCMLLHAHPVESVCVYVSVHVFCPKTWPTSCYWALLPPCNTCSCAGALPACLPLHKSPCLSPSLMSLTLPLPQHNTSVPHTLYHNTHLPYTQHTHCVNCSTLLS